MEEEKKKYTASAQVEQARQEGVSIACDVYPYTAGSTQLVHVLPPESQKGGLEVLTENLSDPAFRKALKARMLTGSDFENISLLVGFENIVASSISLEDLRKYEGQSIAAIAQQERKEPFTALFDLLQAAHCDVTMIDFIADEDDICDILRDAYSCVISDSTYPTTGMFHPRVYGTYTTLLEHFVREKRALSIESAVHKCTGRAAKVMGLKTKGILSSVEGCLLSLEGAGDAAESSHSLLQTVTETSAFHHGRVTVSPCVLPIVSQSTSTGAFA